MALSAGQGAIDGCVALGCVIRGETSHYDIVATMPPLADQLAVQHAVPIGFGILTCESREQAWERASVDGRNKGSDAARACLTLMRSSAFLLRERALVP